MRCICGAPPPSLGYAVAAPMQAAFLLVTWPLTHLLTKLPDLFRFEMAASIQAAFRRASTRLLRSV